MVGRLALVALLAGLGCREGELGVADRRAHSSTIATLRGTGLIVTVDADEEVVTLVEPVTGAVLPMSLPGEPTRVATWRDRIWVTLRESGHVVELEATTTGLEEVARTRVGSEPVGIVADSDGSRLYVAVSVDQRIVELDADTFEVVRSFDTSTEVRWLALHPAGHLFAVGPASGTLFNIDLHGSALVRHRLWLSEGQSRVTGDPDISPNGKEIVIPTVEMEDPIPKIDGYYATDAIPGSPAVVSPELTFVVLNARTGDVEGSPRGVALERSSYATSATWDSAWSVVATLPGADSVQRVDSRNRGQDEVLVGSGPWGVAMGDDGAAWVHERFERGMVSLDDPYRPLGMGESSLSPQFLVGRDLFYTTDDARITSGGISCASCHFEGRTDGRTWQLETGRWQTPSLAGGVDATAPVSWAQGVGSVAEEASLTAEGPMGGHGGADYDALAAYINSIRLPNPATPEVGPEVLAMGERAFATASCTTCHMAPLYTDNNSWALFGGPPVQTPTLRGIGRTAPYFQDGRAATLEEVLVMAEGHMGAPQLLSPASREALVHYLESL